jgi:inactivated superfamily I helicase
MINKLLVFPTQRAKRDFISKNKDSNSFLDKSMSIGEFFSGCIIQKQNKTLISKNIRYLYLKKACEKIDLTPLGVDKNYKNFLEISSYVFEFFNDISSSLVEIKNIIQNDIYLKYEEHLKLLEQISFSYIKLLDEHNLCDDIIKILLVNVMINL